MYENEFLACKYIYDNIVEESEEGGETSAQFEDIPQGYTSLLCGVGKNKLKHKKK